MPRFTIRRFEPGDAPRICEIFYRSVHEVAASHYDDVQRQAWAPRVPDASRWERSLREYHTFLALDESDSAVAWIAMTPKGYVDMLFCLPEAIGSGAASQLYLAVESVAVTAGIKRMSAHASLLAQPFFAKHGWDIYHHEQHERNGVVLPRAEMFKDL